MSAHDEAVQAAYEQRFEQGGNNTRQIITTYLRHMRAAGYVVTRVPDRATAINGLGWMQGFNEAIAIILANTIEVPE